MARIIVGCYVVRCPLGGYQSLALQWLVGFQRLGHEVYCVEKSGWPNSCYDPVKDVMGDDCAYGTAALAALLARFGLADKWCFVDAAGQYHGMSRQQIEDVFRGAEVFVELGSHGAWREEARHTGVRVFIDGDPGYTQMNRFKVSDLDYDYYYTVGRNIGTSRSPVPTMGKIWRPIFSPVVLDLFEPQPVPRSAPFTTVMAWQSYRSFTYADTTYGQKDVEFEKFKDLPSHTAIPLELVVSGDKVPVSDLTRAGWRLRNPLQVTASFDTYRDYITASQGEFTVCKNVYVATNSGWFSERSATYLASGRPVVTQDTGLEGHLPQGDGFFAVRSVGEAAAAIDKIVTNYRHHSAAAKELASAYLDTSTVFRRLIEEVAA